MNSLDKLGIWNLALGKLGVGVRVASLTDTTTQALACAASWNHCVELAFRSVPWTFAEKRAPLTTLMAGDIITIDGHEIQASSLSYMRTDWAYRYLYPLDCLFLHELCPEGSSRMMSGSKVPHVLGTETYSYDETVGEVTTTVTKGLRVIYTDLPEAEAIYTQNLIDIPNAWDPAVVQVVAYAMAAEMAWTMTGKGEIKDQMERHLAAAIFRASAVNLNEGEKRPDPESSLTTGRW